MSEDKLITVSESRLKHLEAEAEWLECLRAAGVDNWEGYSYACDLWHEAHPNEEG